jgi:large subunit ribosomal protein L34
MATKRTLQPSKGRRIKKLGFRAKMKSFDGRKVLKRRKVKGRRKLTP